MMRAGPGIPPLDAAQSGRAGGGAAAALALLPPRGHGDGCGAGPGPTPASAAPPHTVTAGVGEVTRREF